MKPKGENLFYQTFVVRGSTQFPVDMLRYDRCFPVQGMHNIEHSMDSMERIRRRKAGETPFEVKLGRWVEGWHTLPTEARWASFMWAVDKDSIITHDVDGHDVPAYSYEEWHREVFS